MIRQYHAHRARGGNNPLRVGVIAVGSIYYLQDDGFWRARFRPRAVCRNPWIVEAFLNGVCAASRYNAETRRWEDVYLSGRSDTAIVRSLRDGRRKTVSVHFLTIHEDADLSSEPTPYPSLPNLAFYRGGELLKTREVKPSHIRRKRQPARRLETALAT
jgi:hypothetical protein